jgi:opacity protein-like surface antigen
MLRNIAIATTLLVLSGTAAQAQGRFGLEVRAGGAIPTEDLGDADLKPGGGFEATANMRVLPHVNIYGGWNMYRFKTDTPLAGSNFDVDDTGYVFGMQFRHPILNSVGGWLQGGGVYKHIELENRAGDIVADSGHELGWEAGGGVSIQVAPGMALTPGVRYRSFSADLELNGVKTPVDMRYVAIELGAFWTFGGRGPAAVARAR